MIVEIRREGVEPWLTGVLRKRPIETLLLDQQESFEMARVHLNRRFLKNLSKEIDAPGFYLRIYGICTTDGEHTVFCSSLIPCDQPLSQF